MKNYSQAGSDQEGTGKISQLLIYVDENNELAFGCDWEDTEGGIEATAEIFYRLKHKGLLENILSILYKQCVIDNRMDVFNEILSSIHSKVLNNTDEDKVVVKPTSQGVNNYVQG